MCVCAGWLVAGPVARGLLRKQKARKGIYKKEGHIRHIICKKPPHSRRSKKVSTRLFVVFCVVYILCYNLVVLCCVGAVLVAVRTVMCFILLIASYTFLHML